MYEKVIVLVRQTMRLWRSKWTKNTSAWSLWVFFLLVLQWSSICVRHSCSKTHTLWRRHTTQKRQTTTKWTSDIVQKSACFLRTNSLIIIGIMRWIALLLLLFITIRLPRRYFWPHRSRTASTLLFCSWFTVVHIGWCSMTSSNVAWNQLI